MLCKRTAAFKTILVRCNFFQNGLFLLLFLFSKIGFCYILSKNDMFLSENEITIFLKMSYNVVNVVLCIFYNLLYQIIEYICQYA